MQVSRSRFKQSEISPLISHMYVLGCCKFFGDFGVYLAINSFSQRISKIYGNRKFGRFDFVLKIRIGSLKLVDVHQTVTTNPGSPFGGFRLSGGFPKLFFPFYLSLNFLKFHLNSGRTPPWRGLGVRSCT